MNTISSKTVYPPRHLEIALGQRFGAITILRRGPNSPQGTAQWWVVNSLNVNPEQEYLVPRRTLWRKRTGSTARHGCGFLKVYPAIYHSVINHFKWVYNPHNPARYHGYKGMPAYDQWNPKHGPAAVVKAVRDILSEIGDKPGREYHLHIVDKRVGFWPGNLMWIPAMQHKREEMINKLIEENFQLRAELKELRGRI